MSIGVPPAAEVLGYILSFCDIKSLTSLRLVNVYFRDLVDGLQPVSVINREEQPKCAVSSLQPLSISFFLECFMYSARASTLSTGLLALPV